MGDWDESVYPVPISFVCGYCGATSDTSVDPGGGPHQQYVEDCQVCCRPNVLNVRADASGALLVQAHYEG